MGTLIIGIIAIVILAVVFFKFVKIPKFGNMVLVTGGVKTGKSTMTVYLAIRQFWKQKFKVWVFNHIIIYIIKALPFKRLKSIKKKEKPLFYSNVPIAVKGYTPLTLDLIERKTRFRYGSVIYVCEASLVADSQSIKNAMVNEEMLLLNKLIAHETKGGYIFYDTQSISDNHYAVKRCLSTYFYIHHLRKVPFFCIAWVRELKYSDDGTAVNTFEDDVETTLQMVIIPKAVWRVFDCYCYSALTDGLTVEEREATITKYDNKKAKKIITFKSYKSIPKEFICKNEEED